MRLLLDCGMLRIRNEKPKHVFLLTETRPIFVGGREHTAVAAQKQFSGILGVIWMSSNSAFANTSTFSFPREVTNNVYQHRYADRNRNVAVYASHATRPGDGFYEHAQQVGAAIADAGMGVVTGGGCGSMRATAEGASSHGGHTVGMAMDFIGEAPSDDVHREFYKFKNFEERLDGFEKRSALTASVPGGMGTMMEITKKLTELSTDKTKLSSQKQMVLFDRNNIFANFKQYLQDNLVANGLMKQSQLDMIKVVDENHVQDGVTMLQSGNRFTSASA